MGTLVVSVAALAAVLAPSPAAGETIQAGNLIASLDGELSPAALPAARGVPATVSESMDVSTGDGSPPPAMNEIDFDFDRDLHFSGGGGPACAPNQIDSLTTDAARAACASSIVGNGTMTVVAVLPMQQPLAMTVPVTVFNAATSDGSPGVLVHAYTTYPAPVANITEMLFTPSQLPGFGSRGSMIVPPLAGGYGRLTHLEMSIGPPFVTASCSSGSQQTAFSLGFMDGTQLGGTLARSCIQSDAAPPAAKRCKSTHHHKRTAVAAKSGKHKPHHCRKRRHRHKAA